MRYLNTVANTNCCNGRGTKGDMKVINDVGGNRHAGGCEMNQKPKVKEKNSPFVRSYTTSWRF